MFSSLEISICATLAYSAVFSYPLSLSELWKRLISFENITIESFLLSLSKLEKAQIIKIDEYSVHLTNSEVISEYEKIQRIQTAIEKTERLKSFINVVKWCPWIEAAGITGSVSADNAVIKDDIDLLIITKPNRLWISRLYIDSWSRIFKRHRPRTVEIPDSWCLNVWLETNSLSMPLKRRSLYTAYESLQIKWIFDRGRWGLMFLEANCWIKTLLPRFWKIQYGRELQKSRELQKGRELQKNLFDFSGTALSFIWEIIGEIGNYPSYLLQKWYMKKHLTIEEVGKNSAFFHPIDTRSRVSERMREKLTFQQLS